MGKQLDSSRAAPGQVWGDNRIVHGLWIGERLSKLEQLAVHSFVSHGHEFHLWLYDELKTPLPREVVLEDAARIIPRDRIIWKRSIDAETGVGRGSVGAPFSDLFRYKLLYEKGGYWVDMDVTCLRPFDFSAEYVFRPHRVGVVGNILKCPPRSELMKRTYQEVEAKADEDSPWLMPNRVLSVNVKSLGLKRFIRPRICNEDHWLEAIKPLIEEDAPVPKDWYAIHWINEMWRTLKESGGRYKGKQYVERPPDKDAIAPGTTLGRLYSRYGLAGSLAPAPQPLLISGARQAPAPAFADDAHINVLLPSLARGGAERSVLEQLAGLGKRGSAKLFVLRETEPAYEPFGLGPRVQVFRLDRTEPSRRLATVAMEILASPSPTVFTHLVHARDLRVLWELGVSTIPVVQNSSPSWQNPPADFDHPRVPFVAAVSEDVAGQLRAQGCPRPVIAVRHELQRWFPVDELEANRKAIRSRYGIPERTLLIGMVGEFKSQKAYTRAVRVLAEVRRHHPAKLMILGGWDHAWGNGRAAYTAACRQAVELGVMPDLITPGPVSDVERYYAAFDVFLNTSVYEGLSIATLEAVQAGCPIVSADAGGNREGLPGSAVIVQDTAAIESYVSGIEKVLADGRQPVATRPPDSDLVPRLWQLLGRYGPPDLYSSADPRADVLFLADNLNLGGAPRSLVNLLCRLPGRRHWLGLLDAGNHQPFLEELERAAVPTFSLRTAGTWLDKAERVFSMIQRLGVRTVVFWNLDARVKLLLAKVLPRGSVRLVDVSPGAWLFEDLDKAADLQRRVTFARADYFERIDHFVAKYSGGGPPGLALPPGKLAIIPNGVPDLAATPSALAGLPAGIDPELVVGTTCRILPSRRLEFLVDMMAELNRQLPRASLIVVGAAARRYVPYLESIQERARSLGVSTIHYVGQQADVASYLRRFKVFVMLGSDHGCPNSSLEAMSLGVPVVANAGGGTSEQIENGVNGFLVKDDPREMAGQVRILLEKTALRRRFGKASQRIVRERFSMEAMVRSYAELLIPEHR